MWGVGVFVSKANSWPSAYRMGTRSVILQSPHLKIYGYNNRENKDFHHRNADSGKCRTENPRRACKTSYSGSSSAHRDRQPTAIPGTDPYLYFHFCRYDVRPIKKCPNPISLHKSVHIPASPGFSNISYYLAGQCWIRFDME